MQNLLPVPIMRQMIESAHHRSTAVLNAFGSPESAKAMTGSPLERADDETEGLVTEQLRPAIYVAADSLRVAAGLAHAALEDPDVAPPLAIGVQVRSAIESASLAVWILSASYRRGVLLRALRQQQRSLTELQNFGGANDKELLPRQRARLEAAVARIGAEPDELGWVSSTRIISEASDAMSFDDLIGRWRVLSGASHGYEWACVAAACRVPIDRLREGRELFRYQANLNHIAEGIFTASIVFGVACRLWRQASANESFPAPDDNAEPGATPALGLEVDAPPTL